MPEEQDLGSTAAEPDGTGDTPAPRESGARGARVRSVLRGLVGTCLHYRVLGLAGEAAFFALLSAPALALGLVAALGYLARAIDVDVVTEVRGAVLDSAATVLTPRTVDDALQPTLQEVLTGHVGMLSAGFLLALWSGSSAVSVYIDTIAVVYRRGGRRGVVWQRVLAMLLYVGGLVVATVLLPMLVLGPKFATALVPGARAAIRVVYWCVLVGLSVGVLTSLYHLAVPGRTWWRHHLPGAVLGLSLWIAESAVLRVYFSVSLENSPLYSSLAAPIAVLLWLYATSLAVLLGATLNAELERTRRPPAGTATAATD